MPSQSYHGIAAKLSAKAKSDTFINMESQCLDWYLKLMCGIFHEIFKQRGFETPDPQRYCNATVNENLELLPQLLTKINKLNKELGSCIK